MILGVLTFIFLAIVLFFWARERRARYRDMIEVMSDDVKRELNLRVSSKSDFDGELAGLKKKSQSKSVLLKMNELSDIERLSDEI